MQDPAAERRSPRPCTGVIIAGGRASRFGGGPKGLAIVGGLRIVDRVALALRESCDSLLLIANDSAAAAWLSGIRVETDIVAGAGALGGIHSGLTHAGTDIIAVAWDMPFVPASLLQALRAEGAVCDAAVPQGAASGTAEPLCAFYSSRCLAAVERRLAAGDLRASSFYQDVDTHIIRDAHLAQHGDPQVMFMNVNTAADLQAAELIVERDMNVSKPVSG